MRVSRRSFVRVVGGGGVILAAGAGGFAATRTPGRALLPWKTAGKGYADPRKKALSYAILAPNPHNRQPWLVALRTPQAIDLYCDRTRLLPETDPFNRQILIGLGCFLELIGIAASQDGYETRIDAFPDGMPGDHLDDRRVARIVLSRSKAVAPDPLFAHVLSRRSNKSRYDTDKPVPATSLAGLVNAGAGLAPTRSVFDPKQVAALRALTWEAHKVEVGTPRTLKESVRLMRLGKSEINASPDGIGLGGFFLETMMAFGLITRKSLADPKSTAFRQGLAMYRDLMHSAMAYVWIETPDNSRAQQLAAGRAWMRINLTAAGLGLGVHPVSQSLQEFPEMGPLHRSVHKMLGATGSRRIQMLARVGFASRPAPSPRWPLTTRIKSA